MIELDVHSDLARVWQSERDVDFRWIVPHSRGSCIHEAVEALGTLKPSRDWFTSTRIIRNTNPERSQWLII